MNLGAIKVPDPRIDALSAIFEPKKTTYAEMRFVDVPGPKSKGSGLDAEALSALAEVDAFCLVVRGFAALDGTPADPARELSDFDAELVLHDLAIVEKRLERMRQEHGKGTSRVPAPGAAPRAPRPGDAAPLHDLERRRGARSWSTTTSSRGGRCWWRSTWPRRAPAAPRAAPGGGGRAAALGADVLSLCAAVEAEIAQLDPAEQPDFLASPWASPSRRAPASSAPPTGCST